MRFPAPGAGSAGFAVTRVLVLVTPGSGRPVPTVIRSTVTTRSFARCFASLRLASSDRLRILNQDSRFSLFPRCIETAIAADVHAPFAQPTGIKRKSACNSSGSTPAEGLPAGELNGVLADKTRRTNRTDLSEQARTKDKIEMNKYLALVVAELVCTQSGRVARAPGRHVHLVHKRGGRLDSLHAPYLS